MISIAFVSLASAFVACLSSKTAKRKAAIAFRKFERGRGKSVDYEFRRLSVFSQYTPDLKFQNLSDEHKKEIEALSEATIVWLFSFTTFSLLLFHLNDKQIATAEIIVWALLGQGCLLFNIVIAVQFTSFTTYTLLKPVAFGMMIASVVAHFFSWQFGAHTIAFLGLLIPGLSLISANIGDAFAFSLRATAIRTYFNLLHLVEGSRNFSAHWWKLSFVDDITLPPMLQNKILPGSILNPYHALEVIKADRGLQWLYSFLGSAALFLPAYFFRFAIKGTFWAYFPLVYIVWTPKHLSDSQGNAVWDRWRGLSFGSYFTFIAAALTLVCSLAVLVSWPGVLVDVGNSYPKEVGDWIVVIIRNFNLSQLSGSTLWVVCTSLLTLVSVVHARYIQWRLELRGPEARPSKLAINLSNIMWRTRSLLVMATVASIVADAVEFSRGFAAT